MQFLFMIIALPIFIATGCATSSERSNANIPEARPLLIAQRVQKLGWLAPNEAHRAASLYTLKCGRCHKFYDPASYSVEDWDLWMAKMSKKSKLRPDEEKVLSAYLVAAREQPKPTPNRLLQTSPSFLP